MSSSEQHRFRVILAFALVYVFWGSTYLGIRLAVQYLPPFVMTAVRFLIAGSLMLAYCALSGRKVRITAIEALRLAIIGILLLTCANATLARAELVVPSGLAALIVAIIPLWFLVLETWVFHGDRVSGKGIAGLGLGIAGIVVLLWPQLTATSALGTKELVYSLALVAASLAWALGSSFSKRWQKGINPFVASGWEMVFGGAVNLVLAFALGEPRRAVWSPKGIGALAYLVVFGSWVGFSAYIWLLQHVQMSKVSTYAYVNPVVAVFLGWIVLQERVDAYILAGSATIIAAVALVTRAEVKPKLGVIEEEPLPMVESTGD
ncbi:MAG TPA: EamA family transporter [Terriglobales bacterium]|nr:EamA family transporter [Terriglobales bacterium]